MRIAIALLLLLAAATDASAALTATVSGGTLTVTLSAADDAAVTCSGGQAKVNGADPTPSTACTAVTSVLVTASGGFPNLVDLSGFTRAAGFSNARLGSSTLVSGPAAAASGGYGIGVDLGPGDDTYVGSDDGLIDEVVGGGAGSDTLASGLGILDFPMQPASGEVDTLLVTGVGTYLDFRISDAVTVDLNGGVGGDPDAIASHAGRVLKLDPASTFKPAGIVGGTGDDTLVGSDQGTVFYVFAGTDAFTGGTEKDIYLFGYITPIQSTTATITDTAGDNSMDFLRLPANDPMTMDLTNGLGGGVLGHTASNQTVINGSLATGGSFVRIFGTEGSDTITGNAKDNIFNDCLGNDVYVGGDGADTFNEMTGFLRLPGASEFVDCGNDRYEGGDGDDTYQFGCRQSASLETKTVVELPNEGSDTISHTRTTCVAGSTSTFDLRSDAELVRVGPGGGPARQIVQSGAAGQFANFENVLAGSNADTVTGNDGDNTLSASNTATLVAGGTGNDTFSGGTLTYAAAPGPVHVNLATGVATGEGTDDVKKVTRVIGSPFDDTMIGKSGSGIVLSGGAGADTMYGDFSNVVNGDAGNDTITLAGGATANGGADDDTLIALLFVDTLNGDAGNDTFVLNGGLHTVHGGAGMDEIDMRNERDDTLDCGADADVVHADQGDTVNADCESVNPGGTGGAPDTTALALVSCGLGNVTFLAASADGSRVFVSTKEALVPTDGDTALDVYELTVDGVRLVSGGTANVDVAFDKISADGAHVFFETTEALPGTGDADTAYDVYERANGTLRLISGGSTNRDSYFGGATADGSRVWFTSSDGLVPADTDDVRDLYERHGATLTLISAPVATALPYVGFGGATADGTIVWFTTNKALLSGDSDGVADVYQRAGGTLTRITPNGLGFSTGFAGASADGSHVYYISDKAPMAIGVGGGTATGGPRAVGETSFTLYDWSAGTSTPVGANASFVGASTDGGRVVFATKQALLPADTDGAVDLYRREGVTLTLLSGSGGDVAVTFAAISADALRVVFATTEVLLPADTDLTTDVYVNDGGTLALLTPGTADVHAVFKGAAADTERVFFRTAEPLVAEDTDTGIDVYERGAGGVALVAGGTGNVTTFFGGTAQNGDVVFFLSDEQLLPADTDAERDLYAVGPSGFPPAPVCTPILPDEVCDNCLDDDGDAAVDRADPDCPEPADGAGAGLGAPKTLGKAAIKCQKALAKSGAKLSAAKLKRLQACAQSGFACVQQKPGDAACTVKAAAKCGKALAGLAADRAKLAAALGKACGPPVLEAADLLGDAGLGFDAEAEPCADRGVATLTSVSDVAACVRATAECRADAIFAAESPRGGELLAALGRDAAADTPCLGDTTNGAGQGLAGSAAKAAVKCQKGLAKAGAGFAGKEQKLLQKCVAAVAACVQLKAGDPACLAKARTTCGKLALKIAAAETKVGTTVAKSCGAVAAAGVLAADGLGFAIHTSTCAGMGVPALATLDDVAACTTRLHECRALQLLENQTPRLGELLDAGGVTP
ncbi:MAG: hypothetical protein IT293_13965 [Deltaproteobacteria bacterium]|nr:hypothetical protein [Deltaproteobacteria bacterium]